MSLEAPSFPFGRGKQAEPQADHDVLGGGSVDDAIADRLQDDGDAIADTVARTA